MSSVRKALLSDAWHVCRAATEPFRIAVIAKGACCNTRATKLNLSSHRQHNGTFVDDREVRVVDAYMFVAQVNGEVSALRRRLAHVSASLAELSKRQETWNTYVAMYVVLCRACLNLVSSSVVPQTTDVAERHGRAAQAAAR
jgi:hypothetical protein